MEEPVSHKAFFFYENSRWGISSRLQVDRKYLSESHGQTERLTEGGTAVAWT